MNIRKKTAISSTIAILVVLLIVVAGFAAYETIQAQSLAGATTTSSAGPTTYTIGAILDETGAASVCGQGGVASANLAIKNVNNLLTMAGSPYRFALNVIDGKTDATTAVQALKTLHDTYGIQAVITGGSFETGPERAVADSDHVVLVSGQSTGISLAIPNDYLYRTISSDNGTIRAMIHAMYQLGYRKVGVIAENSAYGGGFLTNFPKLWAQLSGTSSVTLSYALQQADYSAEVTQFSQKINSLGVDNRTAWLWIGEQDDGIKIFSRAATDPVLSQVKLFVYDDPVFGAGLYPPNAPPAVGQFLKSNLVMGFHNSVATVHNLFADMFYNNRPTPDCYGNPYTYDAVWILAKAMMLVGNNGTQIKNILPYVAMDYVGVTGPMQFDAAGDNAYSSYATYGVGQFTNSTWYVYQNGFYDAVKQIWTPTPSQPVLSKFGTG